MTALQKRQLQGVEEAMSAMVAELSPRVFFPSAEKQAELRIAEETMLIPVAKRRAITLNANTEGGWSVKEFDTSAGALDPVWEHESELGGDLIIEVVLAAAIKSLKEQLAAKGPEAVAKDERAQLDQILKLLQTRHTALVADGLESFEFLPVPAAPAPPAPPAAKHAAPVVSASEPELIAN